jgi:sulfate adenylyltransferase subunit 1 (EFTu-like GTPase family)
MRSSTSPLTSALWSPTSSTARPHTLQRHEDTTRLGLNDIGGVRVRTTEAVHYDPYTRNRLTGKLILIDEPANTTVAAGIIVARAACRHRPVPLTDISVKA